jgi:hypothetical protein
MCSSCGCGRPHDDHGDHRHITVEDVEAAAQAATITPTDVAENIVESLSPSTTPLAAAQKALSTPAVLFDFDNTLSWFQESAMSLLAGRGYMFDERTAPLHLKGVLKPEDKEFLHTWHADPAAVWQLPPDMRILDLVTELMTDQRHVIVSSNRPASTAAAVREWIKWWGDVEPQTAIEGQGSKARLSASYGPDAPLVWVDDDPDMWAFARPGVTIVALTRPWTPPKAPANVLIAKTIQDIRTALGLASRPYP